MDRKTTIFIGSSTEGKDVARAVEWHLAPDFDVHLWSSGTIFQAGRTSIESLVENVGRFDFAVLVITPDDLLVKRGEERYSARDNVLFELGLAIGLIGRDRTFILADPAKTNLPTDLQGVVIVPYSLDRALHEGRSAMSPPCTEIREAIRYGERTKDAQDLRRERDPALSGLRAYYDLFPTPEIFAAIRSARREVRLLQTWISHWNDVRECLRDAIAASSADGAVLTIKIILIDPESPMCDARGQHGGEKEGAAAVLAGIAIQHLAAFRDDSGLPPELFDLKLSCELPTFASFFADERLYFTPYLRRRNTVQSPSFRFANADQGFAVHLRQHFDALWTSLPSYRLPSSAG